MDKLSLLICVLGVNFLINSIARIFHANDVGPSLVTDLLNKRLGQANIFTVGMEMNNDLFGTALNVHTRNEVLI